MENLAIDAINVLILEALGRIPPAWPRIRVAAASSEFLTFTLFCSRGHAHV